MTDMTLTTIVKNKIAEFIQARGLNINDFSFDVITYHAYEEVTARPLGNYECSRLKHKESSYYFAFNHVGAIFNPTFSPSGIEKTGQKRDLDWKGLFDTFGKWLYDLKLELNEPDLWGEMDNIFRFKSPFKVDESKTYFTESEILKISKHLINIKTQLIAELRPSTQQLNILNEKVDYLIESVKKQDKQSWYFLFIGVVFNIAFYFDIPQKVVGYFQPIINMLNTTRGLLGIN